MTSVHFTDLCLLGGQSRRKRPAGGACVSQPSCRTRDRAGDVSPGKIWDQRHVRHARHSDCPWNDLGCRSEDCVRFLHLIYRFPLTNIRCSKNQCLKPKSGVREMMLIWFTVEVCQDHWGTDHISSTLEKMCQQFSLWPSNLLQVRWNQALDSLVICQRNTNGSRRAVMWDEFCKQAVGGAVCRFARVETESVKT